MTRAARHGLVVTLVLIAAAVLLPLAGWQVHPRADGDDGVAPLHALWDPGLGPGTVPALALAVAAVAWGAGLAARLRWSRLLTLAYVAGLAWMLALALVDGPSGISRVLGNPDEYLRSARQVSSVHTLLETYISRIPFDAPDNWPVHLAGHPPGMVLFFVLLVRIGLGGDLAAGLVVIVLAATLPLAVLTTLRALGLESAGRRVAPYLVLSPAAVFLAVSADAVMAATIAWGLALLALAAGRPMCSGWPLAMLAGILLGAAAEMSYGLPLAGTLALGVLVVARSWWPLVVAGPAAVIVVVAFAAAGFAWWEAYPVLVERYWDGVAARRPAAYWLWGDLAALAISAGPLVGAGLGATWAARRQAPGVAVLVGAAVLAIVAADLSRMSKAEVERIWLPFVPWLSLGLALLPDRWRRPALAGQLATALLVQHLLYTSW